MSNRNDWDTFQDVIEASNGVFDGSVGLKNHDSVKPFVTPQGVALQFECQGCGNPKKLIVEYPEMIALKYGVNPEIAFRGIPGVLDEPTRWEFLPAEQSWRPDRRCPGCFWFPIRIDPQEPERYLQMARRRGYINPAVEQKLSAIAAKAAQNGQAVRR